MTTVTHSHEPFELPFYGQIYIDVDEIVQTLTNIVNKNHQLVAISGVDFRESCVDMTLGGLESV